MLGVPAAVLCRLLRFLWAAVGRHAELLLARIWTPLKHVAHPPPLTAEAGCLVHQQVVFALGTPQRAWRACLLTIAILTAVWAEGCLQQLAHLRVGCCAVLPALRTTPQGSNQKGTSSEQAAIMPCPGLLNEHAKCSSLLFGECMAGCAIARTLCRQAAHANSLGDGYCGRQSDC